MPQVVPIPRRAAAVGMEFSDQPEFPQLFQRVFDVAFIEAHHRIAVALLIAAGRECLECERIVFRSGQTFFDQHPEHSPLRA